MKQERYKDKSEQDFIDECSETLSPEEFKGAMKFTIGKYLRRLGKKDDEKLESYKVADYSDRWCQAIGAESPRIQAKREVLEELLEELYGPVPPTAFPSPTLSARDVIERKLKELQS